MNYLLDTHTLLWLLDDESAIPVNTRTQLKNSANELHISIASIWEIAIKRSIGKLDINRPTQTIVDELPNVAVTLRSILASHVLQVETLPLYHKDPFDRIIIAQALVEGWIVVSKDPNFPLYPIEVLWS